MDIGDEKRIASGSEHILPEAKLHRWSSDDQNLTMQLNKTSEVEHSGKISSSSMNYVNGTQPIDIMHIGVSSDDLECFKKESFTRRPENKCSGKTDAHYNERQNTQKADLCHPENIRIALYMEAVKVFRGKGADRRFADYINCLGQYLSSNTMVRSSTNVATNGVEWVLQNFLTTKKLKRLHNIYIKSLLKQCLRKEVSKKRFIHHIPIQWRSMVKSKKSNNYDSKNMERKPLDDILRDIQSSYCCKSSIWSPFSMIRVGPSLSFQGNHHQIALGNSASYQSSRIPGVLEVNLLAEHILKGKEYCLSQSALWAISIAIKEHILGIIRDAVRYFDECNNYASVPRRTISSYDLMQIISDELERNQRTLSGLSWEHLASNSYQEFPTDSSSTPNNVLYQINKAPTMNGGQSQPFDVSHEERRFKAAVENRDVHLNESSSGCDGFSVVFE